MVWNDCRGRIKCIYLLDKSIHFLHPLQPFTVYSLKALCFMLYALRFAVYALRQRISFGDPVGLEIMFQVQEVGVTEFHLIQ
jgi:hypothetical protein